MRTEFLCVKCKYLCLSDTSVLAVVTVKVQTVIEYKSLTESVSS